VAAPSADRINARAAKDRQFLKRALANPGLRAKLDPKYLSGPQAASRALNTRLNAPITAGSTTTERDLAHAAQAATSVKYGPQETQANQLIGTAQQTQRDTGDYYNQYIQQLQQHQSNVAAFQQGAQTALAQTAQGITGLSGQQGAELQAQATQRAAQQGVAQAGDLSGMASNAAAVRQALIGSFQAQQAGTGAAANTYADTLANVVAPGQKLSAQAQAAGKVKDAQKKLADLKALEGDYNQTFRDTRRQDEFKNVLAQQTLTGNQTIAAGKVAASAAANDPATVAAKTSATASASTAAKYGYTAHQWAMLGPTARNKIITDAKKTSSGASDTVYTSGPFAGRKKSEIAALPDSERRQIVDDYNKGKGGKGTSGKGPDWQPQGQQQTFWNRVDSVVAVANKLGANKDMSQSERKQIGDRIMADPKTPGSLAVSVALDKIIGHLSPNNVKRLHDAGYQVKTGGVPTRAQAGITPEEARKRRARRSPGQTAAQYIPGTRQ
jgi:hypothetical protein